MTRTWLKDWFLVGAPPGFDLATALTWADDELDSSPHAAAGALPERMTGSTLLHVGSEAGALCLEAVRRGASRVLGIDRNAERVAVARSCATVMGLPAEFRTYDPEEGLPPGQFHFVVCSDLGSHPDPAALVDRLARMTDETLILEWEGFSGRHARAYLDRIGAPRLSDGLERLPAVLVADGPAPHSRSYLSAAAVEQLLRARNGRFSRVTIRPLGRTGRFRAVATRRVITRLVVVAAAGRAEASWVVRRIRDGSAPRSLLDRIGLDDPAPWRFAPDGDVSELSERVTPGLVVGYDLHEAWQRHTGRFGSDRLADLIESAAEVHVVTSWADPDVLKMRGRIRVGRSSLKLRHLERHRLRAMLQAVARLTRRAVKAPPSRWTPSRARRFIRKARRELDLARRTLRERRRMETRQADERAYRRTDEHLLRYARWLDYCHRVDADAHWILDTTDANWGVEAAERWGHLLIERARRRYRERL